MSVLNGIRILDFGRVLSAPYGTMVLADLGADVVKVEHPDHGDDTRSFGPPFVNGISTYFLSINRGKRSVCFDLKNQAEKAKVKSLALSADVIVENFRSGVMKRLGLDAATLLEEKPELIYCSLTGFGRDETERAGYDLMMQGLSGIPSITGPTDGEPYKCGASIADLVAGMNLVQGILAALYRRERTGKGGIVDVSMMDGMLSLLTYHASAFWNAGVAPQKMGNAHPSIHPFQPYRCQDGFLTICIGNDDLFARLCDVLEHSEWKNDPRFKSNPSRVAHREELDAFLEPIFVQETRFFWKERLVNVGIPADVVSSIPEALNLTEAVTHQHPNGGTVVRSLRLPFQIDNLPTATERRAPKLGEHKKEILGEWLNLWEM